MRVLADCFAVLYYNIIFIWIWLRYLVSNIMCTATVTIVLTDIYYVNGMLVFFSKYTRINENILNYLFCSCILICPRGCLWLFAYFTVHWCFFVHQCNSRNRPDHPEIFLICWQYVYGSCLIWRLYFCERIIVTWGMSFVYTKNNNIIGNCFCLFQSVKQYLFVRPTCICDPILW